MNPPVEIQRVEVVEEEDEDHEELPIDPSVCGEPADNDYLLAVMLQHEYNNEFNGLMKKYESTVNRNSKGLLVF